MSPKNLNADFSPSTIPVVPPSGASASSSFNFRVSNIVIAFVMTPSISFFIASLKISLSLHIATNAAITPTIIAVTSSRGPAPSTASLPKTDSFFPASLRATESFLSLDNLVPSLVKGSIIPRIGILSSFQESLIATPAAAMLATTGAMAFTAGVSNSLVSASKIAVNVL